MHRSCCRFPVAYSRRRRVPDDHALQELILLRVNPRFVVHASRRASCIAGRALGTLVDELRPSRAVTAKPLATSTFPGSAWPPWTTQRRVRAARIDITAAELALNPCHIPAASSQCRRSSTSGASGSAAAFSAISARVFDPHPSVGSDPRPRTHIVALTPTCRAGVELEGAGRTQSGAGRVDVSRGVAPHPSRAQLPWKSPGD